MNLDNKEITSKDKQIKEIALILCKSCKLGGYCFCDIKPCYLSFRLAESIFDAGYRKAYTEFYFCDIDGCEGYYVGCGSNCPNSILVQRSKQTLLNYIEKLKEHYPHSDSVRRTIDKVAKEFNIGDL